MVGERTKCSQMRKRGTVLVMVIGVLSMLFIVGASLLIVGQFERQTVQTQAAGRDLQTVGSAVAEPIIAQLREDVVGNDGIPYNRGWNTNETSLIEDSADFPGLYDDASTNQEIIRGGDLLLSSIEPYLNNTLAIPRWEQFALTWPIDAPLIGAIPGRNQICNRPIDITNNPAGDADGDGLGDSNAALLGVISGMFGGDFQIQLRVVPHGGMVLLDPLTHPSLLSQVIHPEDPYFENPQKLWDRDNPITTENRLRRRFMLPAYVSKNDNDEVIFSDLDTLDLRIRLPRTLGYKVPSSSPNAVGKELTPHWWPVNNELDDADNAWLTAKLTPDVPLTGDVLAGTANTYDAGSDVYDRRRLITTANSDDLLRPWRDEERLREHNTTMLPIRNMVHGELYYVCNPASTAGPDGYGIEMQPKQAYGWNSPFVPQQTDVVFNNNPALRTAFSLRDVLVDPRNNLDNKNQGQQASYTRAVQLTAYYLSMMQHTTMPGSNDPRTGLLDDNLMEQQLRAAAQLAVNTIDYADNGDGDADGVVDPSLTPPDHLDYISYFTYTAANGATVDVFGVEKQPFITEVYAQVSSVYVSSTENVQAGKDNSIYAVEIYNPYDEPIDLRGFILSVDPGATTDDVELGNSIYDWSPAASKTYAIDAHQTLVFANRISDPLAAAGTADPNFVFNGSNPFVIQAKADDGMGNLVDVDMTLPSAASGQTIDLCVTKSRILNLEKMTVGNTPPDFVVVDRVNPGDTNNCIVTSHPDSGIDFAVAPKDMTGFTAASNATYWRYTSLQRFKEANQANQARPMFWRFTLSHQAGFQSQTYDAGDTNITGPPIHSLLNADNSGDFHDDDYIRDNEPEFVSIAPFPILVADRGVDPLTLGCRAFPTTGSLLLVTGENQIDQVGNYMPVTVAATQLPLGVSRPLNSAVPTDLGQLQQLDNGHLPIFDTLQICMDLTGEQGRFDMPWGQLVFDYFTALPIEELYRPLDLSGVPGGSLGTSTALIGLDDYDFTRAYDYLFPLYAKVEQVAEAPSAVGSTVKGRININAAPWWVLDGLPALPDRMILPVDASDNLLTGVPVPEIYTSLLDPTNTGAHSPAGQMFVNLLMEGPKPPNNLEPRLINISPILAKYMVSYRETVPNSLDITRQIPRSVEGVQVPWPTSPNPLDVDPITGRFSQSPGFVTVGALCDLVRRIPLPQVDTLVDGGTETTLKPSVGDPDATKIERLRGYYYDMTIGNPLTRVYPFAYLGYLQLVAPIVRLEDWATVKSHVFTIYASMGDSSDPPLWLRTQVTVDRTRCLYSNDLPRRIAEIEPVGYYNAIDDE